MLKNCQSLQLAQALISTKQARINLSHNNSIWDLTTNWTKRQTDIQQLYHRCRYKLSPQISYSIKKELVSSFEAQDAVLFRALAKNISAALAPQLSKLITHLKGHGGVKGTVNEISELLAEYKYFYKTDAKSFYQSIDTDILMDKAKKSIKDNRIINILKQYCNRLEWRDGTYITHTRGIPQGCSISPLMGALYLNELATSFEKCNVYFICYMDDFLILSKTMWQLRNARKKLYKHLNKLNLETRPEKTDTGKITQGFEFLGYRFTRQGLSLSCNSIKRVRVKFKQLNGQTRCMKRLADYLTRYYNYAKGGVKTLLIESVVAKQLQQIISSFFNFHFNLENNPCLINQEVNSMKQLITLCNNLSVKTRAPITSV
jgi:hypothetical protein